MDPMTTTSLMSTEFAASHVPVAPQTGGAAAARVTSWNQHNVPEPQVHGRTTTNQAYVGRSAAQVKRFQPAVTGKDRLMTLDPYLGSEVVGLTRTDYVGRKPAGPTLPACDSVQKWEHHSREGDAQNRHVTSMRNDYHAAAKYGLELRNPKPANNIAPWHQRPEIRPAGAGAATSATIYCPPQRLPSDRNPNQMDLRGSSVRMPLHEAAPLYRTTAADLQWPVNPEMRQPAVPLPSSVQLR
jgi:hypothetical protein